MASRYFALVPAAGHSSRMGRPKLLLPLAGRPLIAHTIDAWRQSHVDAIVVVIRPDDHDLATAIGQIGTQRFNLVAGTKPGPGEPPGGPTPRPASDKPQIDLVIPPFPPPDMKASLQAALRHIEKRHQPTTADAFLVAPADMPRLSPAIIRRLIECHLSGRNPDILVPTIAGQRGHPVLFPWPLAAEVFDLAEDEGLNAILDRRPTQLVPCDGLTKDAASAFADIDTPDQFRQLTDDL